MLFLMSFHVRKEMKKKHFNDMFSDAQTTQTEY